METARNDEKASLASLSAYQAELILTAADLSKLPFAASNVGAEALAEQARERLEHLASGTFVIALIGEFKRGKSMLANALLGAQLMPSDVTTATATINRICYGYAPRAVLRFTDGRSENADINNLIAHVTRVTQESAARAALIEEARIEVPVRLCENNVELLDTPGLGDDAAMSERTRAVLSRIDAALMVVNAGVAFSEAELELLADVTRHVDPRRIFVVINQIDRIEDPADRPRVIQAAAKRAEKVLGEPPQIFGVSALQGLKAKLAGDSAGVAASGIEAFENALESFLVTRRGLARLQAANQNVESLADAIEEIAAERAVALEAADGASYVRLAALEANLDTIEERVENWTDESSERLVSFIKEEQNRLEARAQELRELALQRLSHVAFTTRDVEYPEERHAKVCAAVNMDLYVRHADTVNEAVKRMCAFYDQESGLAAGLLAAWDNALATDLATDIDSAVARATMDRYATEFLGDCQAKLNLVVESHERFERAYISGCNYESLSGFWARTVSGNLTDVAAAFPEKYRGHLPGVVNSALGTAALVPSMATALSETREVMAGSLEKLGGVIKISIDERKWILRLQREQMEKTRVREDERISSAREICTDLRERAVKRRDVLNRITDKPEVETAIAI